MTEIALMKARERLSGLSRELQKNPSTVVRITNRGKPAMTLNAGQTFLIPSGAVHNATNTGTRPARILATYIVEKGKPLATPAGAK